MRRLWLVIAVGACGIDSEALVDGANESGEVLAKEQWSAQDSPFLFAPELETRFDALPSSGEVAHVPWAGSYWPVAGDAINFQWAGAGTDSPARKYERAFGGVGVEDAVSRAHGIDGATDQRACTRDSDCTGAVCAKRRGRSSGRCIPTWWGLCHAWAPAAILLPEPRAAVTRNGVRFEVPDLKALASVVHDRTRTKFVSLRCDEDASKLDVDRYGRPTSSACRDTNAGSYHVLLANWLGRMRQSFVEDRTADDEVWNQPLRAFRVLSQREVSAAEANRLVGAGTEVTYRFDGAAVRFVDVQTEVQFITETEASTGYVGPGVGAYTRADRYEYVLELDAAGKVLGGEWVGASKSAHPDFLWLPLGPSEPAAASGAIAYDAVKALVMESAGAAAGGPEATRTESFALPRDGWKFLGPYAAGAGPVSVEMTGTGDADLFVRMGAQASPAVYDCRPWLSTSVESCTVRGPGPLYVAVHGYTAASVTVRLRFAAEATAPRLEVRGQVAAGQLRLYSMPVTAGRAVVLRTEAADDVDLYVRFGAAPTTGRYDARGFTNSGNESVRVVPPATGTLFLGVHGYEASAFVLSASEG